MISFAAKLRSGQQVLGIGLSETDMLRMKNGEPVVLDLASVGVGLWVREQDGSRTFLQPRDSNVVVIAGDSAADIGEFLQIKLPPLDELKN